jgi:hypothetical protein
MALVALAGILAMHGASGEAHTGLLTTPSASAEMASHPAAGHDHQAHDHDGHDPCSVCHNHAAALCAFIVVAVVVTARRSAGALTTFQAPPRRPSVRSWTPDPPVPRFALVPLS